jgi:hypothetical protein
MIGTRPISRLRFIFIRFLTGVLLLLAAGCQSFREEITAKTQKKQFRQPVNFNGERQLPTGLRRVLVLPVYGGQVAATEACQVLDEVLLNALQKKARFEVVAISDVTASRIFRRPPFCPTSFLRNSARPTGPKPCCLSTSPFIRLTRRWRWDSGPSWLWCRMSG